MEPLCDWTGLDGDSHYKQVLNYNALTLQLTGYLVQATVNTAWFIRLNLIALVLISLDCLGFNVLVVKFLHLMSDLFFKNTEHSHSILCFS